MLYDLVDQCMRCMSHRVLLAVVEIAWIDVHGDVRLARREMDDGVQEVAVQCMHHDRAGQLADVSRVCGEMDKDPCVCRSFRTDSEKEEREVCQSASWVS